MKIMSVLAKPSMLGIRKTSTMGNEKLCAKPDDVFCRDSKIQKMTDCDLMQTISTKDVLVTNSIYQSYFTHEVSLQICKGVSA